MQREARAVEFRFLPLWKLSQMFKKLVFQESCFLPFTRADEQDIALDKAFSLLRRGKTTMRFPVNFSAASLNDLVLGKSV